MDVAIPIFDDLTALDAVGPYEVLSRLPGARVRWVAREARPHRADRGLTIVADAVYEDVAHPDVVVVPGGAGNRALLDDERTLAWLRGAHATSAWTTSVCTGSLLLGAAGILEGLRATTHWANVGDLARYGAIPVADERVVEQDKVVTAAGVSAGIDMALTLVARIAGDVVAQAVQLGVEYDPQPPFDTGSLAKAGPGLEELVRGAGLD